MGRILRIIPAFIAATMMAVPLSAFQNSSGEVSPKSRTQIHRCSTQSSVNHPENSSDRHETPVGCSPAYCADIYPEEPDTLDRREKITESVVTSRKERKTVEGMMSGRLRLDAAGISVLPKFLGASDILKTVQLLPGVQTSGEMDSGIYIRGGDPGQNLVLLDGARIYSPSHLLGFFSIFNGDHISSALVLKSGLPARYGSFASGVIDISTADSLTQRTEGTFTLGLISSFGTIKTPVGKKSQLTASGRGTYINYILKAVAGVTGDDTDLPEYGFYDFNLTWLTEIDKNNTLKINGYYGRDRLYFLQENFGVLASMLWHNAAGSVIWESHPDSGPANRHTLSFSNFDNNISIEREPASLEMPSGIMDISYKGVTSFRLGQSRIDFGADYTWHRTGVQYPDINGLNSLINTSHAPGPYNTHEFGLYADWSKWFSFPLTIDIGLRYSGAVTGKTFYGGLEPRISLSFTPAPSMRIQAGLHRQRQYLNMVSISGMGMPTDFWIPVCENVGPQIADGVSAGFSHSVLGGLIEYSIEPYFTLLENVLEYDGEMFDMINRKYIPEEHIISGKGRNYGVEMMLKKNRGKVNGWISYTLGRAERSFPDIMGGAVFPAKHDRRHNLSIVGNYEPADRLAFSAVFVYATGTAYTPPAGIYIIGENMIQEYGPHNSARMPDYHRLDLSVTYSFKAKGRCRHSLNLSVYNVYARKNPLYRDLRFSYDLELKTLDLQMESVSLYSLVPSLSYTLKF